MEKYVLEAPSIIPSTKTIITQNKITEFYLNEMKIKRSLSQAIYLRSENVCLIKKVSILFQFGKQGLNLVKIFNLRNLTILFPCFLNARTNERRNYLLAIQKRKQNILPDFQMNIFKGISKPSLV